MKKLKEYVNTGEFRIIDAFNHSFVERLPRNEALEKYGECMVDCSYTDGFCKDSKPGEPSFITSVWVEIPGMRIGPWNGTNLHLLFCGNYDEASFVGKVSGMYITVMRHGRDDYEAWWHENENDDELRGYSVRGTAEQIIAEIKEEWGA